MNILLQSSNDTIVEFRFLFFVYCFFNFSAMKVMPTKGEIDFFGKERKMERVLKFCTLSKI